MNLTPQHICAAAQTGAAAALEHWEALQLQQRNQEQDKRLQNIKILLNNYHKFKALAENAVYDAEQADELVDLLLLMWDPTKKADRIVESIKRSALRTNIIVTHMDAMILSYRSMVYHNCSQVAKRRFETMYDRYIAQPMLSASEIAEKNSLDISVVYDDLDIAANNLASIMFGVDYILLK